MFGLIRSEAGAVSLESMLAEVDKLVAIRRVRLPEDPFLPSSAVGGTPRSCIDKTFVSICIFEGDDRDRTGVVWFVLSHREGPGGAGRR